MLNENVVKNINKLNSEQDNINLELSKKANKEHKHNASDIEGLTIVANAEDINYTNINNTEVKNSKQALDTLFVDAETNKKSILDIENLKEVDNIKCTTDTGEYTIENSKKGYLTNFNIQGKTLVNLANPNNIYTTDGVRYNNPFKYIESGKTYTFVNFCDKQIKYTYGGIGNVVVQANSKVLYTIPNNVLDIPAMMCYGHTTEGWGETDLDKQKISKAMLVLEGDYTSENITYFEGLQSVGQGGSIELLSYKSDANLFDGEFRNGSYIDDGSFYADNNATSNKNFIMVDGNEKYSINYDLDVTGKIFEYDENKKYIKSTAITNAFSFTTSEKTKYINFFIGTNSVGYSPCIKFMINFGEIKEYEPYKYDKKSITHTLRSLPSGVKDEIIYKNGCYKLIQRCGEINQNGQGNWILHANSTDTTLLFYTPITEGSYNNTNNMDLYCNRFKAGLIYETTSNYEGIYETKTNIWIRILRSRLTTQDLAGFKTWLSNNNVTLVRQLKESKEIQLNTLNLEQYNNQTKFICNTGAVIPSINFESTQNLGSHIEVIRGTLKELSEKIEKIENTETLEEMIGDSDGVTVTKAYNCIYRNYTNKTINSVKTYGTNLTSINIEAEYSTDMRGKVHLRDIDSSENLLISVDNKKLIKRSCSNSGKYWEHNLNNNIMDCVNVDKRDNSIIVCYSSKGCIEKLNSNGGITWTLNITGSQPLLCCSIDKEGYIATGGYDNKVQRVSPNGSLLFEYAGFTNFVTAIATDSQGNIILGGYGYRADPPKGIQKISSQGELLWEYNYLTKTTPIYSITVDSQDNIYVCGWDNHLVKLSKDGKFIWSISINTTETFDRTLIDSKDNIYYLSKHYFYKISNDGQTIEKFTTSESKFVNVELITIDKIHSDRIWCLDYSLGTNSYLYRYNYPNDFTSSSALTFLKSYKAGLK